MTATDGEERPLPRHPPRSLLDLVEVELEGLTQALFSVRQDVGDALAGCADEEALRRAAETLRGVTAGVGVLLALSRSMRADRRSDPGLFDRASDAFAVVRRTGEILFMTATTTGAEHQRIALTPFEERTWTDRTQMRAHLELAWAEGWAEDAFEVAQVDGSSISMHLHTERVDAEGDAVLLINHVADGPAERG